MALHCASVKFRDVDPTNRLAQVAMKWERGSCLIRQSRSTIGPTAILSISQREAVTLINLFSPIESIRFSSEVRHGRSTQEQGCND